MKEKENKMENIKILSIWRSLKIICWKIITGYAIVKIDILNWKEKKMFDVSFY